MHGAGDWAGTHTGFLADLLLGSLKMERGRIVIDRVTGQTSVRAKYLCGWGLHEWRARGGGCGGRWQAGRGGALLGVAEVLRRLKSGVKRACMTPTLECYDVCRDQVPESVLAG